MSNTDGTPDSNTGQTDPAATDPAATDPAATDPETTVPAVTEPVVAVPAVTVPVVTVPVVTPTVVTTPPVMNQTAPAPPWVLQVRSTDVSVKLSWLPFTGATGYVVKRSLQKGGPYTAVTQI